MRIPFSTEYFLEALRAIATMEREYDRVSLRAFVRGERARSYAYAMSLYLLEREADSRRDLMLSVDGNQHLFEVAA